MTIAVGMVFIASGPEQQGIEHSFAVVLVRFGVPRLRSRSRIFGQQQDLSKENGSLETIRAGRQVRGVAKR